MYNNNGGERYGGDKYVIISFGGGGRTSNF
jgi:hypothetical protein